MTTLPDIAGDNGVHNIGTLAFANSLQNVAYWVQFIVTGTGTVRIGDSSVSASRGLPVVAGGGMMLPYFGRTQQYTLGNISVYVPTGATLSVGYE